MLNTAFVAWALLATLSRRYLLTAIILLVGSLSHETVLIMGIPLCVAFWFLDWRERHATVMQGVQAMALLAIGVIAFGAVQQVLSASPQQIAKAISAGPIPDHSQWLRAGAVDPRLVASYMTAGGLRTLATSNCMMYSSPGAYLYSVSCFATLFLYVFIYPLTSKVGIAIFGVACLLPMIFLSIIAIDYGRWLAFAVMNGWLCTAALCIRGRVSGPQAGWRYAISGMALLPLLVLGPADVFTSSYRIRELGAKIYGPSMNDPSLFLSRCDPRWKAVAQGIDTR